MIIDLEHYIHILNKTDTDGDTLLKVIAYWQMSSLPDKYWFGGFLLQAKNGLFIYLTGYSTPTNIKTRKEYFFNPPSIYELGHEYLDEFSDRLSSLKGFQFEGQPMANWMINPVELNEWHKNNCPNLEFGR